jgi:succinate dehydrogenase / fumarate reductase cytochrome b subunit
VATGFRSPWVAGFYLIAMIGLGLHLYHGLWSSGRSLGLSQPSPRPLQRPLAVALAGFIWLGFTAIVAAGFLGIIGGER